MGKPHSRSDSLLFTSRSCTEKMFKLTFVLLLLAPCCFAQCTTQSCDTESPDTQMKVIMQRLDELSLENNKLKTTIGGLETTIGRLETTIDAQETTIGGLETTNEELRTDIAQIQMTSTASTAYFSVAANSDETYSYLEAIKFPVTYTDVVPAGSTGGWDAATNMYMCPITGDYMFVVTLYKWGGDDSYDYFSAFLTRTSLSGADTDISRLYNYKQSSISGRIAFSSTMQAIVPCRAGEKVWVKAKCGCRLFDDSLHLNTFTGLKL